MSSQEKAAQLSSQIAYKTVLEENGTLVQCGEASSIAYASAEASYPATFAATEQDAEVSFVSTVSASSISGVLGATMTNTIVSNKSLLLLELSYGYVSGDTSMKQTFEYYCNLYPNLFGKIQIIDSSIDIHTGQVITNNEGIIKNNIAILEEYYNKGYSLFIGFGTSTILKGVLPWFNEHPLAKGISLTSTSDSLSFPKSVYRFITISKYISSLAEIFQQSNIIYYVYSANEVNSATVLKLLNTLYPNKVKSFAAEPDSSNLTLQNIEDFYQGATDEDSTFMLLFVNNQQNTFLNLFSSDYVMPTNTYDVLTNGVPIISDISKPGIVNKYYRLSVISLSTSILYRQGLQDLKENFLPNVPNALLLINALSTNSSLSSLPGENSVLEFDENNDIKYYTIAFFLYSQDEQQNYFFKKYSYYCYDPIAGQFTVLL